MGQHRAGATAPSFERGADRERVLGVLEVPDHDGHVRVSIREPAPLPTVVQITFEREVPDSEDHPMVARAKEALLALDDACGVPYVGPAECGRLSTRVCRAFRAR